MKTKQLLAGIVLPIPPGVGLPVTEIKPCPREDALWCPGQAKEARADENASAGCEVSAEQARKYTVKERRSLCEPGLE